MTASQELKDRGGETLFRFALGSMRRLLAWNVDPHPGNFLFRPDGSVSFLDFGCVKHYDSDDMAQVQRMVRAVVAGDALALRAEFVEAGLFDATTGPAPEEVLTWYRPGFELLTAPQPYTMTPELVARVIENLVSFRASSSRSCRRRPPPPPCSERRTSISASTNVRVPVSTANPGAGSGRSPAHQCASPSGSG